MGGGISVGLGFGLGLVWVSVRVLLIQFNWNRINFNWISGKKNLKLKENKIAQLDEESSSWEENKIPQLWFAAPSLTATESVIDVDSYSGDTVGRQRFHRLAFFKIGRNAG